MHKIEMYLYVNLSCEERNFSKNLALSSEGFGSFLAVLT